MSWIESEANRANRNQLAVNLIIGLASGAGAADILHDTVTDWNFHPPIVVWLQALALVVIFVIAARYFAKAIYRLRDIEATPIWQYLKPFGEPRQLSADIDQDLLAPPVKYKGLKITQNWLIHRHLLSSSVSPIADIAWVYELVTRHRTNGIPTGKSYSAVILGRHKQKLSVRASKRKVDALIAELKQRAPWAIFGFSEELKTTWNKNHPAFVAAIDERKHKLGVK